MRFPTYGLILSVHLQNLPITARRPETGISVHSTATLKLFPQLYPFKLQGCIIYDLFCLMMQRNRQDAQLFCAIENIFPIFEK